MDNQFIGPKVRELGSVVDVFNVTCKLLTSVSVSFHYFFYFVASFLIGLILIFDFFTIFS